MRDAHGGESDVTEEHGAARAILEYLNRRWWEGSRDEAEVKQIVRKAGLSRTTAYRLLSADGGRTIDLSSVLESSGSKSRRFSIPADAGRLVSIDLGTRHWRVAVSNLRPELESVTYRQGSGAVLEDRNGVLRAVGGAVEELCGEAPDDIAGTVVGVPLMLEKEGVLPQGAVRRNFDPLPYFANELPWLGVPHLESDVCLGAIAEADAIRRAPRRPPGPVTMIYLKWSSALRASVMVDDRVHRGTGHAGSFVHVPVGERRDCDECGRQCVASEASLGRIVERVRALPAEGDASAPLRVDGDHAEASADSLLALAAQDPRVRRILEDAATAVGRSIGLAANVLAPECIVVGGAFKEGVTGPLFDAIHEGFRATATPEVVDGCSTTIQPGRHIGRAAVVGGLVLAAQRFTVDHLLDRAKRAAPAPS